MDKGFLKVAAVSPELKVADVWYNADKIVGAIVDCEKQNVKVIVFPKLCLTGASCGDLFFQKSLQKDSLSALSMIAEKTKSTDAVIVLGLPFLKRSKLYNCAVVLQSGKVLGMIPSGTNGGEMSRYFCSGSGQIETVGLFGYEIPFGEKLIFQNSEYESISLAVEIGFDRNAVIPPSANLATAGAAIIANPAAFIATAGELANQTAEISALSKRILSGYIFANAGADESTTDGVYQGLNIIAENGEILTQNDLFDGGKVVSDIDVDRISSERMKHSCWLNADTNEYKTVLFSFKDNKQHPLTRQFAKSPFIPKTNQQQYFKDILDIQARSLAKRIKHIGCKKAVLGISGGLDSTLALIASVNAMKILGKPTTDVLAITMPCFGTSDRTYQNAKKLCDGFSVSLEEVNITETVLSCFKDIGHDQNNHNTTFENAQARVRTNLLMNHANNVSGIVVGTGDLSELSLGWATYNGDHMSMYGVNGSIPKSVMQDVVRYVASYQDEPLRSTLLDIVATPISPELIPIKEEETKQKTENIVGPYELHDFFTYYIVKYSYTPSKLFYMAQNAFSEKYDDQTIIKWLKTYYKRFFANQFKRSCSVDGPLVTEISLSPRGSLNMPSDGVPTVWLNEIDKL